MHLDGVISPFQPVMIGCRAMARYNPFRPGGMVTPGMFCGRFHEIRQTEHGHFQTKHSNPYHFVFEGERGVGKSSLFRLLDYVANGEIKTLDGEILRFVVVNIELRAAMNYDDIVDRIFVEL